MKTRIVMGKHTYLRKVFRNGEPGLKTIERGEAREGDYQITRHGRGEDCVLVKADATNWEPITNSLCFVPGGDGRLYLLNYLRKHGY